MSGYLGDIHKLTTADGQELFFPRNDLRLKSYGDYGAPPIEFITRRGYKQHGSTEIDYLLGERQVEVEIWQAPACNRQAYWDMRLALHEILRPNRGGQLTLTLIMPNGEQRALRVRADSGLQFPPEDNNNWSIEERINFRAFDPIWFDPDLTDTDYAMSEEIGTDLVFPITFPIVFGTSGLVFSTGTIDYQGTWRTYPIFTLTGPYTSVTIMNMATGVLLTMVVPILSTDTRIIDLTPGSQSIVDANGVSRYNELGIQSNLIDFSIRPDPEVADGEQEIQVVMLGATLGQSSARITYYDRYFAI